MNILLIIDFSENVSNFTKSFMHERFGTKLIYSKATRAYQTYFTFFFLKNLYNKVYVTEIPHIQVVTYI